MILFNRHPEKASIPAPADLREAEFRKVRGFYVEGFVQKVSLRECGRLIPFAAAPFSKLIGCATLGVCFRSPTQSGSPAKFPGP
jgi:hypothetical protein